MNIGEHQELEIESKHFYEMKSEPELHPIRDDDIQPENEHPNKTMLKRDLRAIALKRLEDGAQTTSDFEEVIKQWDHLDANRERKELIYFLYLRGFTTKQLTTLRNQNDRNIRDVRSTILGQIKKKVLMILVDRQGENFPFTTEKLAKKKPL